MRGLTPPHQKCDAERPCTTCVNKGRDVECKYAPRRQYRPTDAADALSVSFDNVSAPLSARILPFQTPAGGSSFSKLPTSPQSDPPDLTRLSSSESTLPSPLPLAPCERQPLKLMARFPREYPSASRIHGAIALLPSSGVSVVQDTYGATKCVSHPVTSSFTVLPSIHIPTIPRPLRIPLSLNPPEHAQVSLVAGSDMDMT